MIEDNSTTYECGTCFKTFKSMEELTEHHKEHKPKSVALPNVNNCIHAFTRQCFTGLDHMNTETAAGYFTDECKECGHKSPEYTISFKRAEQ